MNIQNRAGPTRDFQKSYEKKVELIRHSNFYQRISKPPDQKLIRSKPLKNETEVSSLWNILLKGNVAKNGPAETGKNDLQRILKTAFGITLQPPLQNNRSPSIILERKNAGRALCYMAI